MKRRISEPMKRRISEPMKRRISEPLFFKPVAPPPAHPEAAPFLAVVGVLRELTGPKQAFAMVLLEVDNAGRVARLDPQSHERLMHLAAQRARKVVGDCIVARLGSRRVVVLLEGPVDETAALAITGRLHQALRAPFEIDHSGLFVTTSIGVGLGEWNAEPLDVLRLSETAIERVKANGGDATVVESQAATAIARVYAA
jgi:GGDEF domain-containing protein